MESQSEKPVLSYPDDQRKVVGAPKPARFKPKWPIAAGLGTTLLLGAGVAVSVLLPSMNTCRGATRSARLRFQERQTEIAQAEEAAKPKPPEQP
jgi:hypothetical protein